MVRLVVRSFLPGAIQAFAHGLHIFQVRIEALGFRERCLCPAQVAAFLVDGGEQGMQLCGSRLGLQTALHGLTRLRRI